MNSRRKLLSLIGLSKTYGWTRKSLLGKINGRVIIGYFTWLSEDTRRYNIYRSLLFYIFSLSIIGQISMAHPKRYRSHFKCDIWTIFYWYFSNHRSFSLQHNFWWRKGQIITSWMRMKADELWTLFRTWLMFTCKIRFHWHGLLPKRLLRCRFQRFSGRNPA